MGSRAALPELQVNHHKDCARSYFLRFSCQVADKVIASSYFMLALGQELEVQGQLAHDLMAQHKYWCLRVLQQHWEELELECLFVYHYLRRRWSFPAPYHFLVLTVLLPYY